jgi:hypothetical protein
LAALDTKLAKPNWQNQIGKTKCIQPAMPTSTRETD